MMYVLKVVEPAGAGPCEMDGGVIEMKIGRKKKQAMIG